ncbi:unnamed protein product [Enterobius vermicularis]|uniref:Ig-like domain-containing protein n=1 Tax=Enterobius vermicularis TaxID=51028 RepID=A0A0N4V3N7_ENTVE|nr:unnamed protein product [Enterobius vermicularis]
MEGLERICKRRKAGRSSVWKPKAKLFASLEMDVDYCLHISINSSSADKNATVGTASASNILGQQVQAIVVVPPFLSCLTSVNGYRIFYTKAPDEKSSSSGWKKLEYETRNLTFNTLKSGRDLELVPNSRYIARIAQMRSDDKKRIDEIVEFDTVNEVPDVPTNLTIYIDYKGIYHVKFKPVIIPCSVESRYVQDYTVEYRAEDFFTNTSWKAYAVQGLNLTGEEEYVDIKLKELTISSASKHSFRVFVDNKTGRFGSKVTNFELNAEARKPKVIIKNGDNLVFRPSLAEEIRLECQAMSIPTAAVRWQWEKNMMQEVYDIETATLDERTVVSFLKIPTRTQNQVVQCEAENIYGIQGATVNITITGPGSPPKNITATNNGRGLFIGWEPPEIPNGKIMTPGQVAATICLRHTSFPLGQISGRLFQCLRWCSACCREHADSA